jgi:lysophospholipase L1-like esterase
VAVSILIILAIAAAAAWHLQRFGALSYFDKEQADNIGLDRLELHAGADAPIRIVLAGTSLTNRGSWAERLEDRLQRCRPGAVRLERISQPGANSVWGEVHIRERLSQPSNRVDLLILEFSINDSSLFRGVPLAESASVLDTILQTADAAGVPVLLATMSPAWGINGLERPGQIAYRGLYRERAAASGAALLDTIAAWRALSSEERRLLVPDGLHPTKEAMERIHMPALFAALEPLLCAEPDPS